MQKNNIIQFQNRLKPLYERLISDVLSFKDVSLFCPQWGEKYQNDNSGIAVYGRATNGWVTTSKDMTKLFPDEFDDLSQEDRIFNRKNQMSWVIECPQPGTYDPKSSPFWRVARGLSSVFHGQDWYKSIYWSNLYKVAPCDKGNPSTRLSDAQFETCVDIMKIELEFLKPKHVVLLTGLGWNYDFLCSLNDNKDPKLLLSPKWDNDNYCIYVYKIGEIYFYASEHPQGKPEQEHIDTLVELINKFN